LILGLRLALWIGLVQLWLLRACGLGRVWGLNAVGAQVDGSLRTVPRRRGFWGGGALAVAAGGWRWREKTLGLVDQLLLLLLEIAEPVLGATPAIDEMNHRTNEITDSPATLEAMAALLIAAKTIHQIIAGIFKITGDGCHDLQELIELLVVWWITAGQSRNPFLEKGSFILSLVGQAPMLGAAAHQAGVAIPQFQDGAIEDVALKRFGIWREIDFHLANAAAISADVAQAGSMRGVNSSGITPHGD